MLYFMLVRENEAVMLRVARRLMDGRRDQADDLVQEAVVAGYKSFCAGKLCDIKAFKTWILRVLFNHFLGICRSDRRCGLMDEIEQEIESRQDTKSPLEAEKNILREELQTEVLKALESLSAEHKSILVLVDMEELSHKEAAETLDLPIGTVKSRLARARHSLASILRIRGLDL
jgi:RNA polymerase sigma-70 factor (ECF subfamily)